MEDKKVGEGIIYLKPIFNHEGEREASKRKIIGANTTNLIEINEIKYEWAYNLYKLMGITNFWIPQEIPMHDDRVKYETALSEHEKRAFELVISFLIALDSFQVEWLAQLKRFITAPEITLSLTAQEFQEALHSFSYQYILESVIDDTLRADEIYNYWRNDEVLKDRNLVISEVYNEFVRNPNEENFIKGIISNYILESIYFYSGFAFFYTLGRQGKMLGTVQEIRFIQRDENTHVTLFKNIINTFQKEFPELWNDKIKAWVQEQFKYAVDSEIKWGKYVTQNQILGLNDKLIERYIKYLGNIRIKQIGFDPIYPEITENPMKWIDDFAKINNTKTDFFQAKPQTYSKASELKW